MTFFRLYNYNVINLKGVYDIYTDTICLFLSRWHKIIDNTFGILTNRGFRVNLWIISTMFRGGVLLGRTKERGLLSYVQRKVPPGHTLEKRKIITFAFHFFHFKTFSGKVEKGFFHFFHFHYRSWKVIFSLFSLSLSLLKSEKITFLLSLSLLKSEKSLFYFHFRFWKVKKSLFQKKS